MRWVQNLAVQRVWLRIEITRKKEDDDDDDESSKGPIALMKTLVSLHMSHKLNSIKQVNLEIINLGILFKKRRNWKKRNKF